MVRTQFLFFKSKAKCKNLILILKKSHGEAKGRRLNLTFEKKGAKVKNSITFEKKISR